MSTVAAEAAAARATVFSIFVPTSIVLGRPADDDVDAAGGQLSVLGSARDARGDDGRRIVSGRSRAPRPPSSGWGGSWPATTASASRRIRRDADGKSRRMKVQVLRDSATVRARDIFDVPHLRGSRLGGAAGVGNRRPGAGDRHRPASDELPVRRSRRPHRGCACCSRAKPSRAQPGDATLHLLVSDLNGKKIAAGEAPLATPEATRCRSRPTSRVPPGSYIVRVGVMDSAGRVGSVDHRIEVARCDARVDDSHRSGARSRARQTRGRSAARAGRVRNRMNGSRSKSTSRRTRAGLESTGVEFEIAATADGPALLQASAALVARPARGLAARAGRRRRCGCCRPAPTSCGRRSRRAAKRLAKCVGRSP